MKKTRVLVVEDSLTVRKYLIDVLTQNDFEVVGEASDGKRAIELCQSLRPDVITLDMMLPVMTGLAATEYIMAHCPTPILIVSASFNRGEVFRTYEALAAGAVDVLDKPTGFEQGQAWEAAFTSALRTVSRVKVITHPRARLSALGKRAAPSTGRRSDVVAIGASTGGPSAILHVLRALPAPFPAPILLVLHIGEPFGASFAEWLDGETPHRVACARGGESLSDLTGRVTMAPPNAHMVVRERKLWLNADPPRYSCRPSVDVLFESLAAELGASTVACILTGMGRDGAAGLLAIKRAGGRTIGQDEASSVVFGMAREAEIIGAVDVMMPLTAIGPALCQAVES
jgi:two-component system chemotaxis response regulator CheB